MANQEGARFVNGPREDITDRTRSIGTEVGEPLFLDEPLDYARDGRAAQALPALELFADENEPQTWAAPLGSGVLTAMAVHAPQLAPPLGSFPKNRAILLAALSIIVAVLAFAGVRAWQVHGIALWQSLGR